MPTSAEADVWLDLINGEVFTLTEVRDAFLASPEPKSIVDPLIPIFQKIFNRQPDELGLGSGPIHRLMLLRPTDPTRPSTTAWCAAAACACSTASSLPWPPRAACPTV